MAEKKIGDRTFRVAPLPAIEALSLWADIMRIAGTGSGRIPAILTAMVGNEGQQAFADVLALQAITDILKQTTTDELIQVVQRVVEAAEIKQPNGQYRSVMLDADFNESGLLPQVVSVAMLVIKENYSDFFIGNGRNGLFATIREVLQTRK